MNQFLPTPEVTSEVSAVVQEFERLYLRVRTTLAEAQSRSVNDAEQRLWQARTARMKRVREMLNPDDLAEILAAIAVLHAEQEAANAAVAGQLAAVDTRAHR